MSRLNRKGPNEEGPMTGRGMGECTTNDNVNQNDEIYEIIVVLGVMLVIGVAKIAGNWMKKNVLKTTQNSINN